MIRGWARSAWFTSKAALEGTFYDLTSNTSLAIGLVILLD